jgi:hypothetical protein
MIIPTEKENTKMLLNYYQTKPMPIEMHNLITMLAENGIPYAVSTLYDGWQIRVFYDREHHHEFDDVVWHSGSHGYLKGLLETFHLGDCDGYETAKQIFEGWQRMFGAG